MFHRLSLSALTLMAAAPALAGGFAPAVVESVPAAPVVVAPAPVAPSADWSGFYLGGQAATGNLTISEDSDVADAFDEEFDGTLFGVHAGYMRDFGRIVAGAELAWDRANFDLESEALGVTSDDGFELDSVLRAGVRVGYDAGRVLPYATVGYARASLSDEFEDAGIDSSQDGYYFGGGVEYAVSERFSIGAEVLRHSFDLEGTDDATDSLLDDIDADLTTIGIRASFRF